MSGEPQVRKGRRRPWRLRRFGARIAAELDGRITLVAGASSSDPDRSRDAARSYGIDPNGAYPDLETLLFHERRRADGVNFLAIVTPNALHFPMARAALAAAIPEASGRDLDSGQYKVWLHVRPAASTCPN